MPPASSVIGATYTHTENVFFFVFFKLILTINMIRPKIPSSMSVMVRQC